MAFAYLLDLFRQVSGILQPSHGGTGHQRGSEILLTRGINSTGATIERRAIVEYTSAVNAPKVQKVATNASTDVLGVCYGYYDGLQLVIDDCPDGYEMAIQIAGVAEILIEGTTTRGQYAVAATTDGQIYSWATAVPGAFGRVIDSQDVSAGATYCRVMLGLPGSGASGSGSPSFGTPALTLGTSNAAGASSDAIRTDASVAAFDATVPVTQAFSDAAATGSAAVAARRDHKHGMPASGVPSFATPAIALGTAAAAGAAGTVIRSDSTIAAFDATAPVTQAFSDAAATGSAAVAARRDHKHGMPALGTGATDAAAGNHTHGGTAGASWTKQIDDDCSAGTNWTSRSGTWTFASGYVRQSDTTIGTPRRLAYTGTTPIAGHVGVVMAQVEIAFQGGQASNRFAGIILMWDGSGNNANGIVVAGVQNPGVGGDPTQGFVDGGSGVNMGGSAYSGTGWYTLKAMLSGWGLAAWKDGTAQKGARLTNAGALTQPYVGLFSQSADVQFRNFKVYTLDPPI